MPNRIIKESVCTSDTLDALSWFEEVVFYRLLVNCDDYGRFDGRAAVIRSRLFPLKNSVTEKSVRDAIHKLSTVGLVTLYEYEGRPYLQLVTWEKHQQVRAKKSKYPANDNTCNQLIADDCKCPRNPIQSESNPPLPPKGKAGVMFDRFWAAYPKKKSKADAQKAFEKLAPGEELLSRMLSALEQQKQSGDWQREGGQYIPYPASWLNGRRWEDEESPTQNRRNYFEEQEY